MAALGGGRDRPGRGGLITGTTASSGSTVTPVANQVIPSVVTIAANGGNGSGTGSDGKPVPATITGRDRRQI